MVKVWISIREQLGGLVFLATSIGLTVVALATWYTNHRFVLDVQSGALMLTASLKSAQLSSNLLLMQILVKQASMRLVPQTALESYYKEGESTNDQWSRTAEDYDAIFAGDEETRIAVQARIYHKEGPHRVLFNRTASSVANVTLPYERPDGQPALMGDYLYGYIPELYPRFNVRTIDRTSDQYDAEYQGRVINRTNSLLSGPYRVSGSLILLSITMPIVSTNTSNPRTIGWLTIVLDAQLISDVINAREGLGDSGLSLLFGPHNVTNNFPAGYLFDSPDVNHPQHVGVQYQILPTKRDDVQRHIQQDTGWKPPYFDWSQYPAVREGFTRATGYRNNAGSMVSTRDEQNHHVAVGYAVVNSSMVDWMVVVERSHAEVWSHINRLRRTILTCVFGTMAAMILVTIPVAHYFSKPIRRLGDATRATVLPLCLGEDQSSDQNDAEDDATGRVLARKRWLFGRVVCYGESFAVHRARKREASKRTQFRVPTKVKNRRHFVHDELTDLTTTFNEMTDELTMQYETLEERVHQRTAELERSKEVAEAANESKTLFIANISHELKTPLNGIMGMCAVCMSENDPTKLRQSLEIIYKSGELLLRLLTDLLTFSKNEIGQHLTLDEKEFTLKDIGSQVLANFGQQAKEGGITLSVKSEDLCDVELHEEGQPTERSDMKLFEREPVADMLLYGDEHRIVQVLLNLVSNGLKFTPAGGSVTVTVRCRGEVYTSDIRRASVQSRRGSLPNPDSRLHAAANADMLISSDGPIVGRPNSQHPPRVARHRALTTPSELWLSFEFEVADTGPGIPEHLHSKIFEPFVQGDLGLNKKYGGTGLGLSICSQLAGLMGGSMSMRSEVGHGSVFVLSIPIRRVGGHGIATANAGVDSVTVTLPSRDRPPDKIWKTQSSGGAHSMRPMQASSGATLSSESPVSAALATALTYTRSEPCMVGLRQPASASAIYPEQSISRAIPVERVELETTKDRRTMKVLVAEDNRTNQEVMVRILKLEDVQDVTVAADGQEALDRVRESLQNLDPYDLVFMDVQMPNLDGLQATRLIRQSGFTASIVALTAYTEATNVQQCLDSGMDLFLSKPIRRSAIRHVLERYRLSINEEVGKTRATTTDETMESGIASSAELRSKRSDPHILG